ncbi:MAG: AraC family transcriptional regulator [Chloroflexi bacterium]|nr:AraC family transcriptional regulator [Chloroflexota bacterium]
MFYPDRAPVTLTQRRLTGALVDGCPPFESLLVNVNCRVLAAGWFPSQPGWHLNRRVMPHYVLFVCVGGTADFVVGGEPYRLTSGSVLLMPPAVPQEGRHDPSDPPMAVYSLHFTARVHGVLDAPALLGLPVLMNSSREQIGRLVEAVKRIISELAAREPGYVLAANGECLRLLTALWRQHLIQAGGRLPDHAIRSAQVARLAPVFQVIQARYAEGLTLEDMAGVLHLHPTYFSTLFKRLTGLPPVHFLARYRLDRARELLVFTDQPVHEIAALTGYGDPSHLRREFRRREGISPRSYREAKTNPALP